MNVFYKFLSDIGAVINRNQGIFFKKKKYASEIIATFHEKNCFKCGIFCFKYAYIRSQTLLEKSFETLMVQIKLISA